MTDFGVVIMGHLVGDFLLQTDTMAQHKEASPLICASHGVVYTLAVYAVIAATGKPWPLWTVPAIFLPHVVVDYTGFAKGWLMGAMGQSEFRDNLAPWSGFIIDSVVHLLCLFVVWRGVM